MPIVPGVAGYAAFLGIGATLPVTVAYDFQSEHIICDEHFIDTNGVRGTRSRAIERERQGNRKIHGPLELQPTALDLTTLLQWGLGGTPTGSPTVTYPLGDILSTRFVVVDRVAKVFTYSGVACNKLVIKGNSGQPLHFTFDLIGMDESVGNAGSFPGGLVIDTTTQPFIFTDLVMTIAGTDYSIKDMTITVDNSIDSERFFNSQTLVGPIAHDRHVMLSCALPYGAAYALYGASTVATGVACTATFTNGSSVLTLSMIKVAFPRQAPSVPGRVEVLLNLAGQAMKSGSTLELVTTLNPTFP